MMSTGVDAGTLREGTMSNVLSDEKRLAVLAALVDGNSERAIERMTGWFLRSNR
jgi:hypothetical protein